MQFKLYPHTVFRFRPYSPLSLKELQYGELFFVANAELNDPYDTRNPSIFENDPEKYERMICNFLGQLKSRNPGLYVVYHGNIDIGSIADFLGQETLGFDELRDLLRSDEFEAIVGAALSGDTNEIMHFSKTFVSYFSSYVYGYVDMLLYIVSFSKNNSNPVMWSHYANHHKGFCLCFSVDDNKVRLRLPLGRNNYEFAIEEVLYSKESVSTPGFYRFPGVVNGKDITPDEKDRYWDKVKRSYLTKFESWDYEEEVRIVDALSWFNSKFDQNGAIVNPVIDRIAYYDQKQLTGIIYGAKMKAKERIELENIIYQMRNNIDATSEALPLFLFYEAKENSRSFMMDIEPIKGLDTNNQFFEMHDLEEAQKMYERIKLHHERMKARGNKDK